MFNMRITAGIIGVVLVAFLFVGVLVYFMGDLLTSDRYVGQGVVTDKKYEPSYTTFDTQRIGDQTYTTPVYHDEEFYVAVSVDGVEAGRVSVPSVEYTQYHVGDTVKVKYLVGGWSDALYITAIYK